MFYVHLSYVNLQCLLATSHELFKAENCIKYNAMQWNAMKWKRSNSKRLSCSFSFYRCCNHRFDFDSLMWTEEKPLCDQIQFSCNSHTFMHAQKSSQVNCILCFSVFSAADISTCSRSLRLQDGSLRNAFNTIQMAKEICDSTGNPSFSTANRFRKSTNNFPTSKTWWIIDSS